MDTIPFRWRQKVALGDLLASLEAGAVCTRYEYVASLVFVTMRWQSKAYLCRSELETYLRGIPYVLFTLVFGWWGLPWGPVESVKALWTNFGGGEDITGEIAEWLETETEPVE